MLSVANEEYQNKMKTKGTSVRTYSQTKTVLKEIYLAKESPLPVITQGNEMIPVLSALRQAS